jgi:hypothetical protein
LSEQLLGGLHRCSSSRRVNASEEGVADMVWFWVRDDGEQLQVETRYDDDVCEFVVTIRSANGPTQSERYPTLETFRARLIALERTLEADRWKNSEPPPIVPDGFPKRRRGDLH